MPWLQAQTSLTREQPCCPQRMHTHARLVVRIACAGVAAAAWGEIPLDGRIWLLLMHGCCLMLEGSHKASRKSLQAAE